ncbi:MAG: YfhO family protein [Vicinamibacteria bacterium]|nr:YfhO family protein [Vicinamibacteria bacterium]
MGLKGASESPRARILRTGLCLVILSIAVAGLLWPTLRGSSVLVAADFLKVWPPWAEGLGDGSRVHNQDLSDSILYYLPVREYGASSIRQGRLPLWNPYLFSGTPFLANGESGLLSPLNVFFLVARAPKAFGYSAALQLLLAGAFMFLLLRRMGLGRAASTFGGLVFMLNGFFIVWLEMLNLVGVALWIPLAVLAADLWIEHRSRGAAALFVAVMCLQFLVGFLQISLYLIAATIAYAIFRATQWRRASLELGGMTLLAAGLSAVQLLPHIELIRLSHRAETHPSLALVNVNILRHLITLIAPDYFGSPLDGSYRGALNYTELCGYVGVVPLALCFLALARVRSRASAYFAALGIGALLVYLETPLDAALWFLVPGYRLGIGSTRIVCLFTFAASGLAALGFDWLSGQARRLPWRQAGIATLFILGALDLLHFGRRHLTMADERLVYPRNDAIEFLKGIPGKWRVTGTPGVLPPDSGMAYGLDSVGGYESLFNRRYREYMATADPSVGADPDYHGVVLSRVESPLLDLINLRFIVTDRVLTDPQLVLRYEGGARVYERMSALPRAFVVWRYRVMPDAAAVLAALREGSVDLANEALLERTPGLAPMSEQGTAEVRIALYEPERVVLDAHLSRPGLLVLGDAWYPGWEARVNGEPREILTANYVVRAVALGGGSHRVEFTFRPVSFLAGRALSIGTLVAAMAAIALWPRRPENT